MIFNQAEFLFLFLPAVLALAVVIHGRARIWLLIIASLFFYAVAGVWHAVVLVLDIVWVYALTNSANYRESRWRLILAIFVPLLGLVYFKYTGFVLGSWFHDGDGAAAISMPFLTGIALPAGISFFTFQLISFAVDRYRGEASTRVTFENFALFISFFPQLVAGPIVRAREVMADIKRVGAYRWRADDLYAGVVYFVTGLALKVLLADTLARYGSAFAQQSASLDAVSAWYFVFNYSFRIYFDFYGYSLCAIGLARLFGIRLPFNFRRPYEALNPKDFWRRWHITLSYWIRDYLYIPLGGNDRYVLNILIVFALCGLWHGAAWTFVVWGLFHALLVIVYSGVSRHWDRLPPFVQAGATFILVSAGWSLFVFDFSDFGHFAAALVGLGGDLWLTTWEHWMVLFAAAAICFGPDLERYARVPPASVSAAVGRGVTLAGLLFVTFLFVDVSDTFIYFRF